MSGGSWGFDLIYQKTRLQADDAEKKGSPIPPPTGWNPIPASLIFWRRLRDKMARRDLKDIEIEIVPCDGTPNPRKLFDRLIPEERHKKIVELYAQIYLKILEKRNQH